MSTQSRVSDYSASSASAATATAARRPPPAAGAHHHTSVSSLIVRKGQPVTGGDCLGVDVTPVVRRGEVGDFDLELLSERIDKQFVAECLSTVYRLSAMLAMGMGLAFLSTKQVVFGNRRGAALSHFEFNRRYKRTCAL